MSKYHVTIYRSQFFILENDMQTIVTRFKFGDTLQEIADATGVTVEQVIAVLRENSKQWDGVND